MKNKAIHSYSRLKYWFVLAAMSIILLLATLLRLPWLSSQSIAFDESFSLVVGVADWSTLFEAILSDGVHPPLFYVIHKSALALWGSSEFGQRFLAAVFSILTVALVYKMGRTLFSQNVGLLGALLMAVNPLQVWLSQEARMYSLLTALTLASMLAFWQALHTKQRRYWLMLTGINSLIFATHYFGFLIPTIQFIFLMTTFSRHYRSLRPWTVTQIIAGLPLLPWLFLTATRDAQIFGIGFLVQPAPLSLNLEQYPIQPLTAGHERAWVVYPYTRRPTHYPMQPLRPDGYWSADPERNPRLVRWFEHHADNIVEYQHFRGIEVWLVDLTTETLGVMQRDD